MHDNAVLYDKQITSQEGHDHEVCPRCGTEMCGGRIYEDWAAKHRPDDPEGQAEYAEAYGAGPLVEAEAAAGGRPVRICGSTVVGVEIRGYYDGVSYWRYPCCGLTVDRWTRKSVRLNNDA